MKLLKRKLLFCLKFEKDSEYKPYNFFYYRLSEYAQGSVRDAAVRLEKAGFLDKIIRNNQSFFRLTSMGRERFKREGGSWDKIWRVVVCLPAQAGDHNRLGGQLTALGYKRLSRGVFISPFGVTEATKQLFLQQNWQNSGLVMETKRLVVGDNRQLVRRLWNLDELGQKYSDFVNFASRLLKLGRQNFALLRQAKGGFKTCLDSYFSLFLADPGLPKALWLDDWQQEEAKGLFGRLSVLAKTAGI
ncbi:MAG: hypothetical protein NTZ93_00025 [Candidatus Beckwithbacteria bacterium]|nr:hypothetical protein [Candidatus Beckwithbacteria bacterium]